MRPYAIVGTAVSPAWAIGKVLHYACRSCSLCGEKTVWKNRIDELKENHRTFEKQDVIPTEAKVICSACYDKHEVTRCAKTGKVFLTEDDCSEQFERDIKKKLSPYHPSSKISGPISPEGLCQIEKEARHLTCAKTGKVFLTEDDCSEQFQWDIKKKLSPYHPSSKISGPISPEGLSQIKKDAKLIEELLTDRWAGGTKQEFLKGYDIIEEIRLIREEKYFRDVAALEEALKLHVAQLGGNGYIKFFWKSHNERHSSRYIKGYGPKGNPYYGTTYSSESYFTGHAIAVRAEPSKRSRYRQKSPT